MNTPWTNGKIESFCRSIEAAEAALARFAGYYNSHWLDGEFAWLTPGERFDGTPLTDRGFDNIPRWRT